MQQRPWYKHGLVWLMIAPPLAAVVGGIAIIVIAFTSADDLIRDDYVKVGLELREDSGRLQAAQELGLSANMRLARDDGQIVVTVQGPATSADNLHLRLIHPTDARRDRDLALVYDGDVYRADLGEATPGRWLVQLEPADQSWRLIGELTADDNIVALGARS